MKIQEPGNYSKPHIQEFKDYVLSALDGSDYERGAIEEVSHTAKNNSEAIARLLLLLVKKKVIELNDVPFVVAKYYDLEEVEEV